MKKQMIIFIEIIALTVFLIIAPITFANKGYFTLEESENGIITVEYKAESDKRIKILITKDDEEYFYDMVDETERFPLQLGDGNYQFAILENVEDDIYRYIYRSAFKVDKIMETDVFLNSVQNVDWTYFDKPIRYVDQLVSDEMSNMEKVHAVHEHIAENYRYDYELYNRLDEITVYLPSITKTFESKKGICYDLTSLMAAMLRSEGIPTKLVMGYRLDTPEYHAWNEVFVDGEWKVIDITLDSNYDETDREYTVFKDADNYDKTGEY